MSLLTTTPNDPTPVSMGVLDQILTRLFPFGQLSTGDTRVSNIASGLMFQSTATSANFNVVVPSSLNRIGAAPFFSGCGGQLKGVQISTTVAAGAGGVARTGIWKMLLTPPNPWFPGQLIYDSGPFATDGATGQLGPLTATNISLDPLTWYWVGAVFQTALPTVRCMTDNTGLAICGAIALTENHGLILGGISGALPNPWPATAGSTQMNTSGANQPYMLIQFS